jgi:hypothetical protein
MLLEYCVAWRVTTFIVTIGGYSPDDPAQDLRAGRTTRRRQIREWPRTLEGASGAQDERILSGRADDLQTDRQPA